MAVKRQSNPSKPQRPRKRKARTEVSSSSESSDTESEVEEKPAVKETKKPKADVTSAKKAKKVAGRSAVKADIGQPTTTPNPDPEPPSSSDSSSDSEEEEEEVLQPNTRHDLPIHATKDADAESAFESFYLRQLTSEVAEDLDKIRSAGDFSDAASLGLLVSALKQGGACFSREERLGVGRGLLASTAATTAAATAESV